MHTGLRVESELTCIVHAHPHAKVTWYKDHSEIHPEMGRIEMKEEKSRHTLRILHTEQKDLGAYTCVAKNRMGQGQKTISLTGNYISLQSNEGFPKHKRLHGLSLESLLLRCSISGEHLWWRDGEHRERGDLKMATGELLPDYRVQGNSVRQSVFCQSARRD